jgi:hypothetical protein
MKARSEDENSDRAFFSALFLRDFRSLSGRDVSLSLFAGHPATTAVRQLRSGRASAKHAADRDAFN